MAETTTHRAADRMARLPMDKTHVFVLLWLFIAWVSEAIDLGGTSYILPSLMTAWGWEKATASLYASTAYVGMFLGAIVIGALADKFGRKKTVVACMIVWGVGGLGMTIATSEAVLFVSRFVLGIGLGAQLPVLMSWVIEVLPVKSRGTGLAFFQAMLTIGFLLACAITLAVLPKFGWRGVIFSEAAPAVFAICVGLFCPESAIWAEAHGKTELAEKLVSWWEEKAVKNTGKELPPVIDHPVEIVEKTSYAELFKRPGNWKLIIGGFLMMFCNMGASYGISTWITSMIAEKGFAIDSAILLAGIGALGALVAAPISAKLANKFGRKAGICVAVVVFIVTALLYGGAASFVFLVIFGILYQFGNGLAVQMVAIIQPEIWSNDQRGAGTGLVSAFGRLGAIGGPIIFGAVTGLGMYSAFVVASAMMVVCALAVLVFLPETKNKQL